MPDIESIKTWVRFGVEHGWCSPLVCSTHSVDYLTDEELEVMSDGDDPCAFVLRVWDA